MAKISRAIQSAPIGKPEETIIKAIEEQSWLDGMAETLQHPIYQVMRQRGLLRSILNGTWLGHPVHAALTDVPVGAWAVGFILDMLETLGLRKDLRKASDTTQTIGLMSALGVAIFGLADWSYTNGRARRVGLVHALLNSTAALVYGISLLLRSRGDRRTGIVLSNVGFGMVFFSAWLGGELSYRFGVGVNRMAFKEEPEEWERLLPERELHDGALHRAEAHGTPILLVKHEGQIFALGDVCTHMGCSLSEGKLLAGQVMCPCHDSHFRLVDGQVMKGPASVAVPSYEVRIAGGFVEVRQPTPAYGMASVR
ncbi:MAG TPA: Rieske 2Fe-2S domain-containing protein [Chloroflexota bacterium]|nr:Rieske 2Fe-2S domain-containing protein [Chloroflexota bacterium]